MTPSRKSLIGAAVLACAALGAFAQTPPASPPAAASVQGQPGQMRAHREDMAQRMQAGHAQRMERLKTILQLTPAQQGAWDSFATAMQPPAAPGADQRGRWEDFSKMTTPQRLDRMQQRMTEREAMFTKRADATKTFYAALTPAQQKAFDAESLPHFGPRGAGGPGGSGGPGGRHMPPPPPSHG